MATQSFSLLYTPAPVTTEYEVHYFTQYLDHFNYSSSQTFQQRYLLSKKYWGAPTTPYAHTDQGNCPGPILFYTGNESPVTDYWPASGFITNRLASAWGALVLFVEHRYFGVSIPSNADPWSNDSLHALTSEQALADYAHFLESFKRQWNITSCPVLAFGGSYGGMLTAWFRSKYPHLVVGGLAASAPFGFYDTSAFDPYKFSDAAEHVLRGTPMASPAESTCDVLMQSEFARLLNASIDDVVEIATEYKLCNPQQSSLQRLLDYIQDALTTMLMLNYPYETNYGIMLPAWPVNATCADAQRYGLATALEKNLWNLPGLNRTCLDIDHDKASFSTGLGWPYLSCTDVYIPMGTRGMWIPHNPYSLEKDTKNCKATFNVGLRPEVPSERYYHGVDFASGASKIIFSNGLLDPWHPLGVLTSLSDTLIAIRISQAAHHLDLRGDREEDPEDVRRARDLEQGILQGWLEEYYKKLH